MFAKEEFTPKNIFSGNVMPVVTGTVKLAASQTVSELSVVYYDTTTKKFYTKAPDLTTFTADNAYALATVDLAPDTEEVEIPVYFTGEFNIDSVVLPEGQDIKDYAIALRNKGIFLK